VSTNSDGFYTAANLLPGGYEATVSARGFNTEKRTGISLTVGAQQVFDLALHVGSATKEVVVVTAEAPAVQLTSSDISAVLNATTVRELPLNGRSWTELAELQPGVNAIQTQPTFAAGTDRGNRGFGQQLTISGARPQQNNYRLDGVSLQRLRKCTPGSVLGNSLLSMCAGGLSPYSGFFAEPSGIAKRTKFNGTNKGGASCDPHLTLDDSLPVL
jgi:hypothetical protein